DLARDHDVVEPGEKIEACAGDAEFLRRPVGERVEPPATSLEIGQHGDRIGDRPGQHLLPAMMVGRDQLAMLRVAGDEQRHRLVPAAAGILLLVPFLRAHRGEEILHCASIGEELAVEVARVPVDEDAAEIEDDGLDADPLAHVGATQTRSISARMKASHCSSWSSATYSSGLCACSM